MTGVWTTGDAIAATAVDASSMNSAAPNMGRTHAASVETATAHAATVKSATTTTETTPAPAASAGERFLWNEAHGDENEHGHNSKNVSKHGSLRCLGCRADRLAPDNSFRYSSRSDLT